MFLELPPVLAHFLEPERNPWIDSTPSIGRMFLREQRGAFVSLDILAGERHFLIEFAGPERARAMRYRAGYEMGRREAAAHLAEFTSSARLALQAGLVFFQLRGCGQADCLRFDIDLDARTLHREVDVRDCSEALAYKLLKADDQHCVCEQTAGYLAGHMSEILTRPVVVVETQCLARGSACCRFVAKFEPEWGEEADWAREALAMEPLTEAFARRDELAETARAAEKRARNALNDLNRRLHSDLLVESLVMDSPAMTPVMRRVRQVMATESPVLEVGEPGVGKETLARAIHFGGVRRKKPFVHVDCNGLRGHLLTQELFGYTTEGVPNATRSHTGAYERAHGGTLFLNEVAHLDMEAQIFLLRAMREGVIYPFGSETPVKCDVRLIAATEHDLRERAAHGEFLEHLYHAIGIIVIEIPPLRDRETDILRLAESFMREFSDRYQRDEMVMAPDFKEVLLDCAWPGNVRQLRAVMEHAIIMADGGSLGMAELPDDVLATRVVRSQEDLSEEVIRAALRKTNNNRSHAADLLGVGRTTLWRAMKRLKID